MTRLTPAIGAPGAFGATPTPAPAAPGAGGVRTRAELLALARAGSAWECVRLAERALAGQPEDHELRALLAARYASLGLTTPAREHIERLSAEARADADAGALSRALEGLGEERVGRAELEANFEGNLGALQARAGVSAEAIARWRQSLGELEVWRTRDRGLAARRSGGSKASWLLTGDQSAAAATASLPFLGANGTVEPARPPKPIVIEGLCPPDLAVRVYRSTPRLADGYAPAILIREPSEEALALAMATADLRELLGDERVRLFVGSASQEELAAWLESRLHLALPSVLMVTPGSAAAAGAHETGRLLEVMHGRQQAEHDSLLARVSAIYAGRDSAWWKGRYEEALGGSGSGAAPLRVLLPISRFSTFVKHSAADLAVALTSIGVETRVLSEPDDNGRLVSLAYLREFERWQPDLVVLINYTRAHLSPNVPASVPFVCWVQDRMQQLFDPRIGAAQGALDFLVGHLHQELFTHYGYPRERRRFFFVPASGAKFHDGPVDERLAARHRCDIAYVSHQSETPEAAHARLRAAFAAQPRLLAAVDSMRDGLSRLVRDGGHPEAARDFSPNAFIRGALEAAGIKDPPDLLLNTIAGNYAVPLLERMHRHVTLEWVASLARRRGWRFHLYGRGWEGHPGLREFHRGEAEHDEDLRALYRTARVNLHISRNTNAHQRVYECALAGGLMLRRGPSPDALVTRYALMWWLRTRRRPQRLTRDQHPAFHLVEGEWPGPELFDEPRLRYTHTDAQGRRIWELIYDRHQWRWFQHAWAPIPLEMLPDAVFPGAAETLFDSETALERAVERALGDEPWRGTTIAAHRGAVRAHCTSERVAEGLLGLVRWGLQAGAGSGR